MRTEYTPFPLLLPLIVRKMGLTMDDVSAAHLEQSKNGYDTMTSRQKANHLLNWFELKIFYGQATHVFLPGKPFTDWLIGCVTKVTREHLGAFWHLTKDDNVVVFHFPIPSGLAATAVSYDRGDPWWYLSMAQPRQTTDGATCAIKVSQDISAQEIDEKMNAPDQPPDTLSEMIRLAVGIGMYTSCFPETVVDGVPEDLQHPGRYKDRKPRTITVSEKVCVAGTHGSPMPHYRRGHFRVLQSERYTNKRFQCVFVRESFVNPAKAKTVLAPEEVSA